MCTGLPVKFRMGSPPHRRGKGPLPRDALPALGITPAWAGKRKQACFLFRHSRDHPRVGGEKADIDDDGLHYKGSPPRGRGKALPGRQLAEPRGITPAQAGKRLFCPPRPLFCRDHPRMGGEKQRMPAKTDKRMGSPPHGRGKVNFPPPASNGTGITPAWAGKS